MRMLHGVAVAGILAGAAGPAMADLPPHLFKAQYEMRLQNQDGRGDRAERQSSLSAHLASTDVRPAIERNATREVVHHAAQIPMKAEYRNRLEAAGVDPERALADRSSLKAASQPGNQSMPAGTITPGRVMHGAPIPLKADVANRLAAAGQNPEALIDKSKSMASRGGHGDSSKHASGKMSLEQRKSLCAHAGICKSMPELMFEGETDVK